MSPAGRAPDLVVHVGLGAAATLLSSALTLLGAELGRQGVRTSSPADAPSVGGAPLLVAAPGPTVPADPSDVEAFCSLQPEQVAAVIERSGARRVRIILSPERQDRLLERGYRAAVADGFTGTLAERFPRWQEPLLDHGPLAEQLRALPGVLDLRVVPLELVAAGQIAYVGALLGALDCARPVDLGPLAAWRVPQEYGPRALRMALAMAPHLDTDDERAKVREYLLSTYGVPVGASPQVLTAEERPQVVHAYRPVNQAFFDTFVPDLPANSYAGRRGLAELGSTLSPVDVRPAPRPPAVPPTGVHAVRARLGRVRRRLFD